MGFNNCRKIAQEIILGVTMLDNVDPNDFNVHVTKCIYNLKLWVFAFGKNLVDIIW